MKKILFIILFLFLSIHLIYAQLYINTEKQKKKGVIENSGVFLGVGTGVGLFYPDEVNQYLKAISSNMYPDQEYTDMLINIVGKLSVSKKLNNKFEIAFITEFATASKTFMESSGNNIIIYNFTRVSPGILSKFYFPIKSGRHSFYIGPGVNYHFMKFEEFEASNVGGKLQFGLSYNFKRFSLQPYMCYDYAVATDDNQTASLELNYSGLQVGFEFHFKFAK